MSVEGVGASSTACVNKDTIHLASLAYCISSLVVLIFKLGESCRYEEAGEIEVNLKTNLYIQQYSLYHFANILVKCSSGAAIKMCIPTFNPDISERPNSVKARKSLTLTAARQSALSSDHVLDNRANIVVDIDLLNEYSNG